MEANRVFIVRSVPDLQRFKRMATGQTVGGKPLEKPYGVAAFDGIVYVTDAKAEPKVKTLGVFPADSHPAILYPAALTTTATEPAAAFLAYLHGPAATAIFARAGFGKPAS